MYSHALASTYDMRLFYRLETHKTCIFYCMHVIPASAPTHPQHQARRYSTNTAKPKRVCERKRKACKQTRQPPPVTPGIPNHPSINKVKPTKCCDGFASWLKVNTTTICHTFACVIFVSLGILESLSFFRNVTYKILNIYGTVYSLHKRMDL